jgi:hypothetical protein
MNRAIYACDVGSTRPQEDGQPNFAWAKVIPSDPNSRVVGSSNILDLTNTYNAIFVAFRWCKSWDGTSKFIGDSSRYVLLRRRASGQTRHALPC